MGQADRQRARSLATSLVSGAIMLAGAAFVVLAVALTFRGGLPFFFLALFVGALGVAVLLGGFFFQLVPLRLDELAEEKRAADAAARLEQRQKDERVGRS